MRKISILAAATALAWAAPSAAQDASSILRTMRQKQLVRWAAVDNYTVQESVRAPVDLGAIAPSGTAPSQYPVFFEKSSADGEVAFRMVSPREYLRQAMRDAGCPEMTPDQMKEYANGLRIMGEVVSAGGGDMPANGGMPGFDMQAVTDSIASTIWNVADKESRDRSPDAIIAASPAAAFVQHARFERVEPVRASRWEPGETDGSGEERDAFLIVAENLSDLPLAQTDGAPKFVLDRISLWIDSQEYVPLRMRIEGTVDQGGRSMPIEIEKLDLDYQPAGPLFEAGNRLTSQVGGAVWSNQGACQDAGIEGEAEGAPGEAGFDASIAALHGHEGHGRPDEKAQQMVSGDELSSVIDVDDISVNEGPPVPRGADGKPVGCGT